MGEIYLIRIRYLTYSTKYQKHTFLTLYLETLREFALPEASTAVSVCLSSYANPIV